MRPLGAQSRAKPLSVAVREESTRGTSFPNRGRLCVNIVRRPVLYEHCALQLNKTDPPGNNTNAAERRPKKGCARCDCGQDHSGEEGVDHAHMPKAKKKVRSPHFTRKRSRYFEPEIPQELERLSCRRHHQSLARSAQAAA